jgi:hypothetical protein
VSWVGGLAEWTEGETAYLSIAFTWKLNEARDRANWYRALGYRVVAGGPATFRPRGYLDGYASRRRQDIARRSLRHANGVVHMKRTPLKRKTPLRARKPMKRYRKPPVPQAIKDHWSRVAALGCCVTFQTPATIHHVHGGSIREAFGKQAMPGAAQKQNDWLVIPLHASMHTGQRGIDNGMGKTLAQWEATYGKQIDYLRKVRQQIWRRFGYDMFAEAGIDEPLN